MRAMLFVQNGTNPPKCIMRRSFVTMDYPLPYRSRKAKAAATKWWVVECDSADAGRALIDRERTHTDMGVERGFCGPAPAGRILASGVNL